MNLSRKTKVGLLATTLLVGAMSLPGFGQNAPGGTDNSATQGGGGGAGGGNGGGGGGGQNGGGQGGGGGGGWRGMDPAQMRQRMMDRIKTMLGSSDDEFSALQPKIEKVMTLTRDISPNMMGMRRGRNGGGGGFGGGGAPGGGEQPQSDVQVKLHDLSTALQDTQTSADDIKAKLQAYRDARTAAKADLVKAQEDLKSVLTPRQEAVLVSMGLLE
jgi:hypothetical protein